MFRSILVPYTLPVKWSFSSLVTLLSGIMDTGRLFLQQPKALSWRAPHVFCVFCFVVVVVVVVVGDLRRLAILCMRGPEILCVCSPSLFVRVGILLLQGQALFIALQKGLFSLLKLLVLF